MKRFTMAGFCLFAILRITAIAWAYESVRLSDMPSGCQLISQDQSGLLMQVDIGTVNFTDVNTADGPFVLLEVDGFARSQKIGEPNLPTCNRLLSVPFGAELETEVQYSEFDEISLPDMGIANPIIPVQPPLSKSGDPSSMPFGYNREIYSRPGFYSLPMASVQPVGIMRALNMALVIVSPFEYDPVKKILRVHNKMTIRVKFNNPDWARTRDMQRRYFSPFYMPVYERVLNFIGQERMLLDDLTIYPVKYLIVSDRMFEAQLQPFIQWKIKKGFTVVTAYTDIIGRTNTAIKNYIHNLYDNGTPDDPAPSFVLLVGDAQQIPPFAHSGHISDLDFCEFTDDNIPEIYYGRFSAQSTNLLQPQIDKTLEYEQYLMPDPSFLGEVTMIAGVDANYAPTYGNGQINYGTNLYFNSSHGIHSNTWLYPSSNGPVEADIIATINSGLSFINYTAHGAHDSWSDPTLTVSNVNNLTNAHKYPLAVGNCCLTNTFGTDYGSPCLGEAWLQGANKGAIGYLGASNLSYWDEDYWWGIGYGPVNSNPSYDENGIGAYDGMFHSHGESVSQHYVTNEAINFCGNLAVTESGSSLTAYYWQIYHLMGDPSVMTYLGVPGANNISHAPTILLTATSLAVNADPGSYIGISMDGIAHGAAYVDSSGTVDVPLIPFDTPGIADIVITAQNRIPYIQTIQVIAPTGPYVIYDGNTINDVNGNSDGRLDCGEQVLLGIQLKNVGPFDADSVAAVLSSADTFVTITDSSEFYGFIPGNNGMANRPDAFAFAISGRTPDTHIIQFILTVRGTTPETWVSNFTLPVYSPLLGFISVQIDDNSGNNNGILDPGETAQLVITLHNFGSSLADSVVGILSEVDPYVSVNDAIGSFGDIAPDSNGSNSANVFIVTASYSCPMGHAFSYNLELSSAGGYVSAINIPSIVGDRATFFYDDFASNLGWTGLGGAAEWTIGAATGGRGNDSYGGPDPAVDNSPTEDNRVLGNDITSGTGGDYSANMSTTYWVTSPTIDCSNYTGIQMTYYHWLGVERNNYDHAYLQAYNGSAWVTLFENGSTTIDESAWSLELYDLSAVADQNPNFKIRFGLGGTDASWNYCGWNIDDITLKGYGRGPSGNPDLSFSITSIADTLVQGDSVIQTFKIYNSGNGLLNIGFSCEDNWLRFFDGQNEVAPHDSINFSVTILSADLNPGLHNCTLDFASNDPDSPAGAIPIALLVQPSGGNCQYVVGDINHNGSFNGIDVSYGVSYFKGGEMPPYSCLCNGSTWFVEGDVNGSCVFNGVDITYMVSYFKGGPAPLPCPACPPIGIAIPGGEEPSRSILDKKIKTQIDSRE